MKEGYLEEFEIVRNGEVYRIDISFNYRVENSYCTEIEITDYDIYDNDGDVKDWILTNEEFKQIKSDVKAEVNK